MLKFIKIYILRIFEHKQCNLKKFGYIKSALKVFCRKDIPQSYYCTWELLRSSVGSNDVTGSREVGKLLPGHGKWTSPVRSPVLPCGKGPAERLEGESKCEPNNFFTNSTSDEDSFLFISYKMRPRVGQYPKECSIVFIMKLISAPFLLAQPFPSPSTIPSNIHSFICLCCSGVVWCHNSHSTRNGDR